MPDQLQRGAAEILDAFRFDLADARRRRDEAARNIRSNPGICADALAELAELLDAIEQRLDDELAPMLRRRAQRDELRDATEALRAALTALAPPADADNVTRFPARTGTD